MAWVKNNFWIFFFGIFAFIGTVMGIVAGVVWWRGHSLMEKGVRVEGHVVRLLYNGSSANAVIEYETDWGGTQTYVSEVSASPPAYAVGETVALWYDPKQPGRIQLDGLDRWFLPLLFGLFFLIFGGIGWGGIAWQFAKQRRQAWLQANGTPLQATLTDVGRNSSVRVNGVSPFVIRCQWLDPVANKVYVFNSDALWYDPSPYLSGNTVTVLIDPGNPRRYWVDTSFLPDLTG